MTDNSSSSNAAANVQPNPAVPAPTATPGSVQQDGNPAQAQGQNIAPDSKNESGFSFGTLDESVQKYLTAQGINESNLNTKDSLEKLVALHKAARVSGSAPQAPVTPSGDARDALNTIVNGSSQNQDPQGQTVPTATPNQVSAQSIAPQTQSGNATEDSSKKIPNEVDIYNMTANLSNQYPALADKIKSGQLYKDMASIGLTPITNGQFNISAILNFANRENELTELRSKLDDVSKPKPDVVPSVRYNVDDSQPKVQAMNPLAAQNIILFSNQQMRTGQPVHPQYEEAVKYIESNPAV